MNNNIRIFNRPIVALIVVALLVTLVALFGVFAPRAWAFEEDPTLILPVSCMDIEGVEVCYNDPTVPPITERDDLPDVTCYQFEEMEACTAPVPEGYVDTAGDYEWAPGEFEEAVLEDGTQLTQEERAELEAVVAEAKAPAQLAPAKAEPVAQAADKPRPSLPKTGV